MLPEWTAVIVNYNGGLYLPACLEALRKQQFRPARILVVDNASSDDSQRELLAYPEAELIALPENRGYAGGANAGLDATDTDLAVILNADVECDPGFGAAMVRAFADDPSLGAAGALLLYPDGATVQHAGGVVSQPSLFTDHLGRGEPVSAAWEVEREIDFATGAALGLRVSAVRDIGGFDEQFMPAYYEDVDLCWVLRAAGWKVRLVPEMRGIHHEGVTLQHSERYHRYLQRNRLRFALKHLSAEAWQRTFVPAEYRRLRYELEHGWSASSGVAGIEQLLRSWDPVEDWTMEPTLSDDPAAVGASEMEALHRHRTMDLGKRGLLKRLAFALVPGARAEALAREQRAFNDAVTRALEASNRSSRRQTADLLLLGLMLVERLVDERADDWDADVTTEINATSPDRTRRERDQDHKR